jgi:protein-S-isoprenylcysteine O-methyltransferase Ste14
MPGVAMKFLRGIGFILTTLIFYLGLSLLGWGVDDLGGFFSMPQRFGYAIAILALSLAVGFQAIETPEGVRGGGGQQGKLLLRQRIAAIFVTMLLLFALVFLPFADRRSLAVMAANDASRWAGLALFIIGMGFVFWSGLALGKLYSADVTVQEDHHLITHGLYRYIRHPRYLGGVLLGVGISLLYRSWIGLLGSAAFIMLILFRIRDEEAFMHAEFGQAWEVYCESSWRLIPPLY